MKLFTLFAGCCLFSSFLFAQDTQFPKGWDMHARLQNGMITNFHQQPDIYTGSLMLVPQYTIIPHRVRAGVAMGLNYAAKKIALLAGPSASLKLVSLETKLFGIGNIHLTMEHLWGTQQQRQVGGGPYVELGHRLVLGLTAHRDYRNNHWLFQSGVAIRINKIKTDSQDFNNPSNQ